MVMRMEHQDDDEVSMSWLKNNKATGSDRLPAVLFKYSQGARIRFVGKHGRLKVWPSSLPNKPSALITLEEKPTVNKMIVPYQSSISAGISTIDQRPVGKRIDTSHLSIDFKAVFV